ncbi:MAG: hypothetical protein ACC633_10090 [Anaerolineales bacterium]
MKNKRFYTISTLALALVLMSAFMFTPNTAYAQSGGGTGSLTASGVGLAGVRGNGTATISGNGILYVRDYGGDANIQVSGEGVRTELPSGWIRYSGFNGQATISGSNFKIGLSGFNINLYATGTGSFVLRGSGSYSVEKDGVVIASGKWVEGVEPIELP